MELAPTTGIAAGITISLTEPGVRIYHHFSFILCTTHVTLPKISEPIVQIALERFYKYNFRTILKVRYIHHTRCVRDIPKNLTKPHPLKHSLRGHPPSY